MSGQGDAPRSGIVGWGAAERILDRCPDRERRELMAGLIVQGGVRGAPGMEYLARLIRWHIDGADFPTVPEKLTELDYRYVQRRALELLDPFVKAGDQRLPREVRGFEGRPAA